MSDRVLVAGLGNIFLGDDGFGVEVVRRLASADLPANVKVADIGIRGVHLAYEMLEGYGLTILVDTVSRGDPPGTVYVIRHESAGASAAAGAAAVDAHSMNPDSVLALLDNLGGTAANVWIVGCEPAEMEERIGLSDTASAAVEEAVRAVLELIERDGATGEHPKNPVGTSET